jgi:hypothetical protein
METTTVNIELTPADLHAFSRYAFRTGIGRGRGIILFILSLLLIGGAFFFKKSGAQPTAPPPGRESASIENVLPNVLPILLFLVLFLFLFHRQLKKGVSRNNPDAFLPSVFRVSDEGVFSENATSSSMHKWAAVRSIIETKEHYFVMLSPMRGYIVPKRSFAMPEAGAAFATAVRARLETGTA